MNVRVRVLRFCHTRTASHIHTGAPVAEIIHLHEAIDDMKRMARAISRRAPKERVIRIGDGRIHRPILISDCQILALIAQESGEAGPILCDLPFPRAKDSHVLRDVVSRTQRLRRYRRDHNTLLILQEMSLRIARREIWKGELDAP